MDVSIPFMGGMEETELIRSYKMYKSLSSTPITALSTHDSAYPTHNMCNFFSTICSKDFAL